MIKEYLKDIILQNFGFKPTSQQLEAVNLLSDFILSERSDEVFMLKGYAGTGKTSLISALVKTMQQVKPDSVVLIAPTGRAAKVFSGYAEYPAYTIHKRIYRQKSIDKDSIFTLNFSMKANLLFICDEASMISNDEYAAGSLYGTGRLLDDLVHFVYGGKGCKLIVMGDDAQLPPVGQEESPALSREELGCFGLDVISHTMTQVVRQAEESGILWNATQLRSLMDTEDIFSLPKIRFKGFADVINITGGELIEALEECYHRDGIDETMVVCRSNKRALIYNNGIRNRVLWREELLESGDLLMVAKNNYYWTEKAKCENIDFIANGDIIEVCRLYNQRQFYGFTFADAEVRLSDYNGETIDITLLLDTLQAEAPALTREQQERLFNSVIEDYEEINVAPEGERPQWKKATKQEKMKALKQDAYFNALQVKYAYAVTCHKAQGGQWTNVFVDQGYMTEDMLGPDYFRWLYTAVTRATKRLYFVNFPKEQLIQ